MNTHALSDHIDSERLRRFFSQNVRSLPTTIYPAIAIWLFFLWVTRSPACLLWAVLIHAWQARRILAGPRPGHASENLQGLKQGERSAVRHVMAFAVLWGLAPWMLMSPGDHAQLSVMLLMLVGVMAGSANGLAFSLNAGWVFQATLGSMLIAWLLWQRTWVDTVLAVSVGVFTGTLMLMFRNQQRNLTALIRARLEQEAQARVLAEQKLELEKLNQERSRLFAMASHDLRQPVQALSLQAKALELRLAHPPDADAARRMGDVAQTVLQSIDSLLDLHHLESLSLQAPDERCDAEELLFAASQIWSELAGRRGLSLRFHGQALTLWAPRVTLVRVLNNLIDNALKYTQDGGVLVAMRRRQRGGRAAVRLEVWDTGPGIPSEHQPQVFQASFHRVHQKTHTLPPQGLGLGLNAVHRVCNHHGWPLGFRSCPGRGSLFWFEVPVVSDAPEVHMTNVTGA
ncbi:sensor histidine kinase [Hydrogenophaga luteola]|uniref:histidine kinase n=1 Tax=Hydrogenophaga luteola TaxID=1591122 RepID=A0ABV7VYJ3_9BURK